MWNIGDSRRKDTILSIILVVVLLVASLLLGLQMSDFTDQAIHQQLENNSDDYAQYLAINQNQRNIISYKIYNSFYPKYLDFMGKVMHSDRVDFYPKEGFRRNIEVQYVEILPENIYRDDLLISGEQSILIKYKVGNALFPTAFEQICPLCGGKHFFFDGDLLYCQFCANTFDPLTGEGISSNQHLKQFMVEITTNEGY